MEEQDIFLEEILKEATLNHKKTLVENKLQLVIVEMIMMVAQVITHR